MFQRYHRIINHTTTTVTTIFTPSSQTLTLRSFQTLTLRSFQTLTNLFTPPPPPQQQQPVLCRFTHSYSPSRAEKAAREFHAPRLSSVLAKCVSTFSTSKSPSMSVADTVEWEEAVLEGKSESDGVVDEDVKGSIPVRAYFFSTRYNISN
ncbi:hypothetical protein Tco_1138178 [Tanacetum coccineum]